MEKQQFEEKEIGERVRVPALNGCLQRNKLLRSVEIDYVAFVIPTYRADNRIIGLCALHCLAH